MPLTIIDFIEQVDGISTEDIPSDERDRINDALADLTGGPGGDGAPVNNDAILVSKNLDDRAGFNSIQDAINGKNSQNNASGAGEDDTIFVESGTYEESVTIDVEGLTLKAADGASPTIEAPSDEKAIETSADDITVDGFEILGANDQSAVEVKTGDIDTGTFTLTDSTVESGDSGPANTVLIAGDGNGFQGPAEVVIEDSVLIDNSGTAALNVFPGETAHASVEVTGSELRGDPGGLRDIDELTFTDNEVVLTTEFALDFEGIDNSTIQDNDFDATDDAAVEFIQDDDDSLNLDAILNKQGNTFDPAGEVDGNRIVPEDEEGGEE